MYCIGLDSYIEQEMNAASTQLCYTDVVYDVTSGVGIKLGNKTFVQVNYVKGLLFYLLKQFYN
jgi:hypothetical protein